MQISATPMWPTPTLAAVALALASAVNAEEGQSGDFFETRIRPVLIQSCLECHGPERANQGLRVDSRTALLKGGHNGPAIIPGNPDASLLIQAIRRTHDEIQMPPEEALPAAAVQDVVQWVEKGAPWPDETSPIARTPQEAARHWAYGPLLDPPIPEAGVPGTLSPIDRFIYARLESENLQPSPPADRRTLLRRVTFDLTGLPPTPEEIDAFVADDSPDALERVVERLLASPQYGERWGRHWLDVVRYADTAGNAPDFPVPQAYRYRDYVIDAFGRDKPYNRFLQEQIAGDLLEYATDEECREGVIATGYLAIHRRFSGTGDELELEDVLNTLGRSVLGLSLSCARCHDHKFDSISTNDYYALYGIFSSTQYPFPGGEGMAQPMNFVPLDEGELAYAVAEGKPADSPVHLGGNPTKHGPTAPRGFLSILGGDRLPENHSASGRLELSRWLTGSGAAPLTARVMVNRIWQHHFGTGLVSTPNDFGVRGQPPTHPELLDWLAGRFIASGWSVKTMHRMIVTSTTYRQSSGARSSAEGAAPLRSSDPENRLLWRFPRRRLDAESIRDAILAASGELDRSIPQGHPFPPQNAWSFSQHAPFTAVYETRCRSVYLMQQRLQRHPFLALFDGADPNASTADRVATTTPLQALFAMNNDFVHRQAEKLAERLLAASSDDRGRLEFAFLLALGRPPRAEETEQASAHLDAYAQRLEQSAVPEDRRPVAPWASLARVLLASNEFLYLD
jgi:hypothetical protein